jgi:outer membrane immunogenic protein
MRKLSLVIFASAALLSFQAKAASPTPYNWSGWYLGALATYGDGDSQHCVPGNCTPQFGISGWTGGATLGFNWQASNIVFGIEGDSSWGKIDGLLITSPGFSCGGGPCTSEVDSLYTVRGRLGVAFDRLLAYGTAGIGWSRLKGGINGNSQGSGTEDTLVWGGGLEYAFAPQWSAKLEYLRAEKFGDFNYDKALACGPPGCSLHNVNFDTVRIGLNYKFGN